MVVLLVEEQLDLLLQVHLDPVLGWSVVLFWLFVYWLGFLLQQVVLDIEFFRNALVYDRDFLFELLDPLFEVVDVRGVLSSLRFVQSFQVGPAPFCLLLVGNHMHEIRVKGSDIFSLDALLILLVYLLAKILIQRFFVKFLRVGISLRCLRKLAELACVLQTFVQLRSFRHINRLFPEVQFLFKGSVGLTCDCFFRLLELNLVLFEVVTFV